MTKGVTNLACRLPSFASSVVLSASYNGRYQLDFYIDVAFSARIKSRNCSRHELAG